jgi:hypothetical protein
MPSTLFHLGIFFNWVSAYAWAGLDKNTPIQASHVAGMTGTCHHVHLLFVGITFQELFVQVGFEP